MKIDVELGSVVFDHLLDAGSVFGEVEAVSATAPADVAPAEMAVAINARGTFEQRELQDTHDRAASQARKLRALFGTD